MKKIILKLRSFIKCILNRYIDHDISQLGGQVAFFAILSVLPFIIYINTLITALDFSHSEIVSFLGHAVPAEVANMISEYVRYISSETQYGILSIGILATVYSASKMIRSIEKSINKAYGITERRGFFRSVFISMAFIICIGIIVIATLYFMIIGGTITHTLFSILHIPLSILEKLNNFKWLVFTGSLFFTLSAMYFIMPYKKIKYRNTLPGTAFAICAFGLLSQGYTIYIKYGLSSSSIYGPLGAVFLVLIWLYAISIVLILGAEINSIFELRTCENSLQ